MLEHQKPLRLREQKDLLIEDSVSTHEADKKPIWHTHKSNVKSMVLAELISLVRTLSGTPSTRSDVVQDALTILLPIFPMPKKVCFVGREKFKMVLKVRKSGIRNKKPSPSV